MFDAVAWDKEHLGQGRKIKRLEQEDDKKGYTWKNKVLKAPVCFQEPTWYKCDQGWTHIVEKAGKNLDLYLWLTYNF